MEDIQTGKTMLLRSFSEDGLCIDVVKDEPSGCPLLELYVEHSGKGCCNLVTLCPCLAKSLQTVLGEASEFVETVTDE